MYEHTHKHTHKSTQLKNTHNKHICTNTHTCINTHTQTHTIFCMQLTLELNCSFCQLFNWSLPSPSSSLSLCHKYTSDWSGSYHNLIIGATNKAIEKIEAIDPVMALLRPLVSVCKHTSMHIHRHAHIHTYIKCIEHFLGKFQAFHFSTGRVFDFFLAEISWPETFSDFLSSKVYSWPLRKRIGFWKI